MEDLDAKADAVARKIQSQFEVMAKDKELAILKCHLMVEEALREYCSAVIADPDELKKAKLSFQQLLHLAKALSANDLNKQWLWDAIHQLNQLRNKLAHALSAAESASNREKELMLILEKNLPSKYLEKAEKAAPKHIFVWKLGYFCAWLHGGLMRAAHTYNSKRATDKED